MFTPTFLYEIIWNLLGVAVLLYLERKFTLRWGKAFGVYLIWYGLGRTYFESIRLDPSEIFFGIRTNVWAALLAILIGLLIIIIQHREHTGIELSPYVPGREWSAPDADVESDDTESEVDDGGNEASDSTGSAEHAATSRSVSN